MSASEHIEELLSGFLDGELTAEELREFEAAMSLDASLVRKVEYFRQLGNDLRSVPKRKLAADFSSRVVAAARKEAISGGSVAPATEVVSAEVKWWRAVAAVAALAASLMFVLYVSNFVSTAGTGSGGGDVVVVPPANPDSNPGESISATDDSTFVRSVPKQAKSFPILPIFEIETSLKAWEENQVLAVLKDEGIVWTNPVIASDDVISTLNRTRSINHGLASSDEEQVALVVVQASGRAIDKAMVEIYDRQNDFPSVFMDLAFDMPGMELFPKVVGKQAFATPIAARKVDKAPAGKDLESVGQFSRARPAKSANSEKIDSIVDAENEICFVLLVIRKPAK